MVKKRRTHKEFVEDLYNVNPNIEVISDFINTQTKIKCKCKIDGYEWESKPTWLLQKRGCPECAKKNLHLKRKRSNEDFVKILIRIPYWDFDNIEQILTDKLLSKII